MKDNTKDFARLYGLVSKQLADLTTGPYWRTQDERDWLAYRTIAFQQLFEDWGHDQNLAQYLADLVEYEGKRVHRLYRLAGHVYLHVAYDLVRGVAATLSSAQIVSPAELCVDPMQSKTFAHPTRVFINSRPAARLAFLAAAPAFSRALESNEALALLGEVTPFFRIFSAMGRRKRRLVLSTISQWVLTLRNAAFVTAEVIADSPPNDRPALVNTLAKELSKAQRKTRGRSELLDFEPWGFPLLSASPVALLADQSWTITAAVLVIAVVWVVWLLIRHSSEKALVAAIDALGFDVLEALVKVRQEANDLPLEPTPKPKN